MPWYALQISYQGERETSKSLIRTVKTSLGRGSDAFIPCVRGEGQGYRKEFGLVEGYVFVFYQKKNMKSLLALEEHPFFDELVTYLDDEGRRQPEEIGEDTIEEMKVSAHSKLENPGGVGEGDWVLVIDGDCRHLEGLVEKVEGSDALVSFEFHSKNKSMVIPLFCLRKAEKDP